MAQAMLGMRADFGGGDRFGPGKAELLERIRDTGSIAAAGRGMGMSYKRAWSLVEGLNAMGRAPRGTRARGGAGGGGAMLTPRGAEVLARFRALEAAARGAAAADLAALAELLRANAPAGDIAAQK
ncbi:MAG: winged helix-turn-helix domain-containing protein [Gemmobacter sp.]